MTELAITDIDRTVVRLPYRDRPKKHMERWLPHWRYGEVLEVTLASGDVGVGETMIYYTWGESTDEDVDRAVGRNAARLMWDDSLGAGLQMALFDAVGRALNVPVYNLVGGKTRDSVPISWWAMDMPGDDWLAESQHAIDAGYTDLKVKGRPWFDIRSIVSRLSEELPEWFTIDIDFNETLLDAERALPVLEELQRYPQVKAFESPIPQEDVEGGQQLTEQVEADIVIHYGRPSPDLSLTKPVCDGFVLNRGARTTMKQGAAVDAVGRPLWLQLVGSGITTAFAVQLGAALDAAEWPAITCHGLFEETLVESPITVTDGRLPVPDDPGLGIELDRSALDRFETTRPESRPEPECLIRTTLEDGTELYFTSGYQMQRCAEQGEFPYYQSGVRTEVIPIDTPEREELYAQSREEHVRREPN